MYSEWLDRKKKEGPIAAVNKGFITAAGGYYCEFPEQDRHKLIKNPGLSRGNTGCFTAQKLERDAACPLFNHRRKKINEQVNKFSYAHLSLGPRQFFFF